jgi:hypothetical protein
MQAIARQFVLAFASGAIVVAASSAVRGQGYSDYYRQTLQTTRRPAVASNPAAYTYDRLFYHSPSISPYSNLLRRNPIGSTSYSTFVRPEQERRERQAAAALPPSAALGTSLAPAVSSYSAPKAPRVTHSSYYNQFYGLPR